MHLHIILLCSFQIHAQLTTGTSTFLLFKAFSFIISTSWVVGKWKYCATGRGNKESAIFSMSFSEWQQLQFLCKVRKIYPWLSSNKKVCIQTMTLRFWNKTWFLKLLIHVDGSTSWSGVSAGKNPHLTSQHVWELLFYTSERMVSLCKLVDIFSGKVVWFVN